MQPLPPLNADCSACAALCCMALPFDAGESFGFDKPALHPCAHLDGYRCGIHGQLAARGFPGCARFDCLGAGQRVMAELFPGADWRRDPELRAPLAEALHRLRRVHEALELLVAAASLDLPEADEAARRDLLARFHPSVGWTRESLDGFDLAGARKDLNGFLERLRAHL